MSAAGMKQNIQIDQYHLIHYLRGGAGFGGTELAVIRCYSERERVYQGSIYFYSKDKVPKSSGTIGQNYFYFALNFEIERYQEIIETLRYEKPLFVDVVWDANKFIIEGNLGTTTGEPIGEQEGI
ncbi:MAG: hypothetical protein MUO26_01225 [Methanotrichaceae archaeon]|nr:hypothetical protein [Methanotrichaceae archaeon]